MKQINYKPLWKRTRRLHIRLTIYEKKQLDELANERGLTVSDFVRVTVTRSTPVAPKAKPDRALFISMLGELGKIGSNVNQIAHELNRQRIVGNGHHVPDLGVEGAISAVKMLSDHLLLILKDGAER